MTARRVTIGVVVAVALTVALVAMVLRLATGVLERPEMFDERWMAPPIVELIEQGWSMRTAVDFEETKGPAMIWAYALLGEVVGAELDDLRLITVGFFVLGVVPLLLIAQRTGMGGWSLALVGLFYLLLPYHAVLGQILMSEASFVFGALWLTWIFLWGFGTGERDAHRVAGPVLFGLLLAVLLHHRVHAVAFAGAAALVALHRDGLRSWPWWLAGAVAGLLRAPLWIRWGGLVSPEFQSMHQSGVGIESATYLAAALVPFTLLLLWPALVDPGNRDRRWMIWVGAALGLLLALVASPSLAETIFFNGNDHPRFKGLVATGIRGVTDAQLLHRVGIGAMAAAGLASLGALAALCLGPRDDDDSTRLVGRFALATLLTGLGMYALTHAFVFDRYMLPWAALLPVVWVGLLPRWGIVVQALMLGAIVVYQVGRWLA